MVLAEQLEDDNTVKLQCMFVTGSDAIGCQVILQLVGQAGSSTENLTRENTHTSAMKVVKLTESSTCISEIFAFDIDFNESVGSLPIPGKLLWNVSSINCKTRDKVEENSNTSSEYCITYANYCLY